MRITVGANRMLAGGVILDEDGVYIYLLCFFIEIVWNEKINNSYDNL